MLEPDLYAILEVPPDAPIDAVRQAYFRLAKVYHPDRQAGSDPAATEHFLAIQTAYEVLSDLHKREDYDRRRISRQKSPASARPAAEPKSESPARSVKAKDAEKPGGRGKPSLSEERDARMGFMKAEELMEAGAEAAALRVMRAVVKAVPDRPEYLSLLGYVMALNGERLHAARDFCRRAVEAEPFNADFLAHLGYVYQAAGLKQTAEQYFSQCLERNPNHPLARVYSEESGKTKEGGLLAGLRRIFSRSA